MGKVALVFTLVMLCMDTYCSVSRGEQVVQRDGIEDRIRELIKENLSREREKIDKLEEELSEIKEQHMVLQNIEQSLQTENMARVTMQDDIKSIKKDIKKLQSSVGLVKSRITCCQEKGSKGDRGLPGMAGQDGTKGDEGLPGRHGTKGEPGEAGNKGEPGPLAHNGLTGAKGDRGQPGMPGRDGAKGDQGPPGMPGSHGCAPGKAGDKGEPGPPAHNGSTGCPYPYVPPVGEASFDDDPDENGLYPVHTAMFFKCPSQNHRRAGPDFRLCQTDGTWDGHEIYCLSLVTCEDPGCPEGVNREGKCCQHGDKLEYSCPSELTLVGARTIWCEASGNWSDEVPTCERKSCPDPGEIENGYSLKQRTHSEGDFRIGDTVRYRCFHGYEMEGYHSKREITCQDDGTWSDANLPNCIVQPSCEDPGTPIGGKRFGLCCLRGHVSTFYCDKHFKLIGPRSIECLKNGTWDDVTPKCERKRICHDPGYIKFADRTENKTHAADSYGPGDRVLYTCNIGYHMTGFNQDHEIICQVTGQWSPTSLPACIEGNQARCKDPGEISHGMRADNKLLMIDGFGPGDSVSFTCDPGYEFYPPVDSYVIKCQQTEEWDREVPRCIPEGSAYCQDPGKITNGHVSKQQSGQGLDFFTGDTIEYTCEHGFFLHFFEDSLTIKCGKDGKWDGVIPECEEVVCRVPSPPSYGYIRPENRTEFRVDESIEFVCIEGYEMKGPAVRTCDHYERDWTAWNPTCKAIICPNPGWPSNGRRIGNDFSVGQSVQFVCESGYQLMGSESRTCLPTKQWDGTLTICDNLEKDCPDPGTPIGGFRTGQQFNLGDVVEYSCEEGFYLIGSASRECLPNSIWSGLPAHCEAGDSFADVAQARSQIAWHLDLLAIGTSSSDLGMRLRKHTTLQSTAMEGLNLYFVFDVSGSIDQTQLSAAKKFTNALVDKLGVSLAGTQIAAVSFDTEVKSAFNIGDPETDTPEAVKDKINNIEHTGRGTALALAFDYIHDEMLPNTTRHNRAGVHNALFLITDGKNNMGGSPIPSADRLKSPPYNMDIFCIGLGSNIDKFTLHKIASSPEKFWPLMSTQDLQAVTDYVLADEQNYEECGVGGMRNPPGRPQVLTGYDVEEITDWPWLAGVYFNLHDSNKKKAYLLECGATLIDESWVLTAASCLHGKSANVSKIDVRMGAISSEKSIIMAVSEIHLHPNYFYLVEGNNIALVKLQHPAVLTPRMRTVCLPQALQSDTDNGKEPEEYRKWYKPATWRMLVGWKQAECASYHSKLCREPTLQQSLVMTRSVKSCSRYSPCTKDIPDTTFCAYVGGISTGLNKSGYPLMVEAKTDRQIDSTENVFQIGILSRSRVGCKYYTKVTAYLAWIHSTMKQKDSIENPQVPWDI